MIELAKMLNLEHVPRWVICARLKQQSVAEHSFNVAAIAGKIMEESGAPRADVDHAIYRALIHDVEEALTGDIPATAKEHNGTGHPAVILADALEAILWFEKWGHPVGKEAIVASVRRKWMSHLIGTPQGVVTAAIRVKEELLGIKG